MKGNFAEQISCRFKILIKLGCSKKKNQNHPARMIFYFLTINFTFLQKYPPRGPGACRQLGFSTDSVNIKKKKHAKMFFFWHFGVKTESWTPPSLFDFWSQKMRRFFYAMNP